MRPIDRSYLFVPGNRPDRFEKALNSGAHSVILDLEDSVAPGEKQAARRLVAEWLNAAQPVVLRVNGAGTEWFDNDVALCSKPGVKAVMIPKVEAVEQVLAVARHSPPGFIMLPQIESARGFASALEIAGCQGVERLTFGPLDFQTDMGIDGDSEELLFFRSNLVLVSRLAGVLPPVDGPTTAIDNPVQLRADSERARRLGFGGKLCIHPKQVSIVNECFRPAPPEVAWATRIVEAAAVSEGGVTVVDGKMVDRPVILQAERILQENKRSSP